MNNKSIILAVTALALAVSCNVMQEESLPLPQKVTFQAVLCDTPPTKTALQSNGAVFWTTGDAINIFYKDNISAKLASDSTATAASAQTSFSGVLEDLVPNGSDYFWAVYPYSGSTTYDGSSVTVTLPSEQYGTPGTFADDLFISMARSMDYTLQFYNLCGGIKFRVANQGIRLVTFAGNNSEILAGQVQATFNSEGKPVVLENLKGATTLRLQSPDDDGFEVGKWYYIVSLPATLSAGYTMTFYNASNEVVAQRVTDTSISIKRAIWGRIAEADNVEAQVSNFITFTSTGTTKISLNNNGATAPVLYYSTDASTWNQWDFSELTFTADSPLYMYGENPEGVNTDRDLHNSFASSGDSFAVSGSIMSLLSGTEEVTTLPYNSFCFAYLFDGCSNLTAAPALPATSLYRAFYCYEYMFRNCTGLTEAPSLPATTISSGCYWGMFSGCSSLLVAPELPATTLSTQCYYALFEGCTSLTAAPELPATVLGDSCYNRMFYNCTSLTSAPELPATELQSLCYAQMFLSCTSLTEAPALPATTLAERCYAGMFWGCSSLTAAPELSATTLASGCYQRMFMQCTSLETAPDLPAATLTDNAYYQMFNGCTSLNYVKCLATDITATDCLTNWVSEVPSTGTFVKAASMNDWPSGVSGIPEGWTVENSDGTSPISVSKYLTFTSTGTTTLSLTNEGGNAPVLYYSTDAQSWTQWDYSELTFTAAAPLYICGNNPNGFSFSNTQYSRFTATGDFFSVSGDIMSLLNKDEELLTIPNEYCFLKLFYQCSLLTSGPSLPATKLAANCYQCMFEGCSALIEAPSLPAMEMVICCYQLMFCGCTSLTTAPALPATSLAFACYNMMFSSCTALKTPPDLPATSLEESCYLAMFMGCTSLTSAPVLSAEVLAEECYSGMFSGCTSLAYVKCLATDITATDCLTDWVSEVPSTGTFVKSASMTGWPVGTSGIPSGWTVENSDGSPLMTASKYLTLTSTGSSSVNVTNTGGNAPVLYYSFNRIDWIEWDYSTLTFTTDAPLYICGSNPDGFSFDTTVYSRFYLFGDNCSVSGDVMSLLDKDEELTEIPTPYCFAFLFGGNSLVSGPSLPATTLATGCYYGMFQENSGLTSAPALPAVTLIDNCYTNMFYGCTALTVAPELSATTLAPSCYANMFNGCTALTTAPSLPVTDLEYRCYYGMFQECTSLVTPPALPATTMAEECYYTMFLNCTSLSTAPELPATTLAPSCYWGMFGGCSALETAPELPATTLAGSCYYNMFERCTGLVSAPVLSAPTLEYCCYTAMFKGCGNLSYVKCLASDISAIDCVLEWMVNVSSTGTFVKAPNTQWPTGYSGIPEGWTVENSGDVPNGGNENTSDEDMD